MSKQDYYTLLEVTREATAVEIKRSYRRLAMKYHPDRNPEDLSAADRFKEISEAYEVLSDEEKRAMYDRFGHAGVNGHGHGAGGFDFSNVFGDIFENVFGGGGRSRSNRGSDLLYELEISLEEAVHGVTREIEIPVAVSCEKCEGTGAKDGKEPAKCHTCGGVGQVRIQQGFLAIQQTCPTCRGEGKVITDPCRVCHGEGLVQKKRKLSVKIPMGVDSGDRIRLAGEGGAGLHGADAGDLYVEVHVKRHDLFERDGNDLYCEVPVSFVSMALGGQVEVPTLNGQAILKIPAETQSGKIFRLRGKGVKSLQSASVGDLFCKVIVETPVGLNEKQKALLLEFEGVLSKDKQSHTPKTESWFDSVKAFFSNAG